MRTGRLHIALFACLLTSVQAFAQNAQKFTIAYDDIPIGELTTTKFEKGKFTRYTLQSKIEVWIVFTIRVEQTIIADYYDGKLIESTVKTKANLNAYESKTKWIKDCYQVDCHSYGYKLRTTYKEPITMSVSKMYYEQPIEGSKVFADNFGNLAVAERIDDAWLVQAGKGKNNFLYVNGILQEVRMPGLFNGNGIKLTRMK